MRFYNFQMSRLAITICGLVAAAGLLPAAALAYSWPVRPFYKPHAIRGYFNDPRRSGPESAFHFGVDIVAPDLTPVYAIEGGLAVTRGMTVSVAPRPGGHQFAYWHVMPAIRNHQRVRQHQLIGYIVPGAGHVHLAEFKDGAYINPLRLGGLAPYIDDTVPRIPELTFYSAGRAIRPEDVTGVVDVTVDAFDPPPLPALPEGWTQSWLSPALIRWRIVKGQEAVRPWETAVDFRTFLMPLSLFTFVYAPGTLQNKFNRPGHYEYYIAHELNTRALANGSYVVQVEALDEQENVGRASFAFTVTNVPPGRARNASPHRRGVGAARG